MKDYEINNLKSYIDAINNVCSNESHYFNNSIINVYDYNKLQNTELEKYFSAIIKNEKKRFDNSLEKNDTNFRKKFDVLSNNQVNFFLQRTLQFGI